MNKGLRIYTANKYLGTETALYDFVNLVASMKTQNVDRF